MAIVLDGNSFQETIKEGVTVVDFWAEWCGPCQQMLPILEDFTKEVEWKAKVGKVNVDENPDIAGEFRVMSIPTLIVFKDGKPVEQLVGVQTKEKLNETIEKYL